MMTIAQAIAQAFEHHRAGRLQEAEALYRAILQADPQHADALQLLAMVLDATDRSEEAVTCLSAALRLRPHFAEGYSNLGNMLCRRGKLDEAIAAYRQAIWLKPGFAEPHYNLGNVLNTRGKTAEAINCYHEAIRLNPDYADAHVNLGNALRELHRLDEAEASYREAVRLRPDSAVAHNNLAIAMQEQGRLDEAESQYIEALRLDPKYAEAHCNLGNVLVRQRRTAEAVACYRRAVQLKPGFAQAHHDLGDALKCLGRLDEAKVSYRNAIRFNPGSAETHHNLGTVLLEQWRLDDAVAVCRHAVALKPDLVQAWNNLGVAHRDQGDFAEANTCFQEALRCDPHFAMGHYNQCTTLKMQGNWPEAIRWCEQALRLEPHNAETHLLLAMTCLQAGDFERGWQEYEWRSRCKGFTSMLGETDRPVWDGRPLEGRTIFLWAEQGLGDTFQFIRYAPLVRARGGRVIVGCQKPLFRLLQGAEGIDQVVAAGMQPPPFDVHAPLLSLPRIFATTLQTIPAEVPYLAPDAGLVRMWRKELAGITELKVGIAWQGSPFYDRDHLRSIPLRHFATLGHVHGVQFYSLQKIHGLVQLPEVEGLLPLVNLDSRLDEKSGPFMDTAALMQSMDLVISSDSAVPHLAGALGVPVWVALPFAADWRYLSGREDSPWYPTMRLFRQKQIGNWDEVFERMVDELASFSARSAPRDCLVHSER